MKYLDLDTAYLVPCKHCAEQMHEWDLFCPFCGKDQTATDGAADARSDVEPEYGISGAGGGVALAPIAVESAVMPQPEAQEAIGHPFPTIAAKEEIISEVGLVRPSAYRHEEVLGGSGPEPGAGSSVTRSRWLIGIAAALLTLLLLAVVHDHFYLDQQSQAGKLREARGDVEQVQSVPDRPAQEQAANQEQPGDPSLKAFKALGLAEPAARPVQAPLPPVAPVAAPPAREIGVAEPKEKECNEALAALALCAKK